MTEHSGETSTQNACPEAPAGNFLTYGNLLKFDIDEYLEDLEKRDERKNAAKNRESVLNMWLMYPPWLNADNDAGAAWLSASLDDLVGDEFGVDFEMRRDEHLRHLKILGLARSTINSRKCILGKLQERWVKLLRDNELPDGFPEALKVLLKRHVVSQRQVAGWCGIGEATVSRWLAGRCLPSRDTLKHVTTIEVNFGLQPGTLVFKLPSLLRGFGSHRGQTQNTPYRKHLVVIWKKLYRLPYDSFTPEQKREWESFKKFYTDNSWAALGLQRHHVGWRTRINNNRNATAEIKRKDVERYYGFLCLPAEPEDPKFRGVEYDPDDKSHQGVRGLDPHLTGMGMDPKAMSLALFTDPVLINEMISFMRRRSFGNCHNTATRTFLCLCAQLTRDEKGFLCQFPEYGRRLNPPVETPERWRARCSDAHKRIKNIVSTIVNNRNRQERFNQSRDTIVEVIKPLIKEREHPISVLVDIAEGLRYDFRHAGTFEDKALLFRNMIMVLILTSNPMRVINIAEMRYKVGSKGYENEPTNLYKIYDGSYRLKYEEEELKNGAIQGRYDLAVNEEIAEDLDRYFREWRPRLVGADECDYVLRPSTHTLPSMLVRYPDAVVRPMDTSCLSGIFRFAAQRYIPNCAGFGLHCARHFVATEYLKFNPGAYEIPAIALHDSEEMVEKAYSWVTPEDKIAFWNRHLGSVLRAARREAA